MVTITASFLSSEKYPFCGITVDSKHSGTEVIWPGHYNSRVDLNKVVPYNKIEISKLKTHCVICYPYFPYEVIEDEIFSLLWKDDSKVNTLLRWSPSEFASMVPTTKTEFYLLLAVRHPS